MQYSNQQPPEGINTSSEHPLKEFFILITGTLAVLIVALIIITESTVFIARQIPFSYEQRIAEQYPVSANRYARESNYLQQLAERLSRHLELPPDMKLSVHYSDADVVNAFATLGGNIVIYRGLIQRLPNENALAMVLAHEIAHIKHRDPIASLGQGLGLSFLLATLGLTNNTAILGKAGLYTVLKFNRDMETAADSEALQAIYIEYGNVDAARAVFDLFQSETNDKRVPQFMLSHPQSQERLDKVLAFAANQPNITTTPVPLPPWLTEADETPSTPDESPP